LLVASLLMTALLAATALFFALALLPLAFLSLAISVRDHQVCPVRSDCVVIP
jgi:hypothetical protein